MPVDNLRFGIESLKIALIKTRTKREQWNKISAPLVKNVFSKVIDEYDLNWDFESLTSRHNAGAVNLSFGKVESGISERDGTGVKQFEKFGGALSFKQLYSGDIEVSILYPYINEIVQPICSHKSLRKVSPENIDEEFIYVQIGKFVNEITAWESATSEDKMG